MKDLKNCASKIKLWVGKYILQAVNNKTYFCIYKSDLTSTIWTYLLASKGTSMFKKLLSLQILAALANRLLSLQNIL